MATIPILARGGVPVVDSRPLGQIGVDLQRNRQIGAQLAELDEARKDRAIARQETAQRKELMSRLDLSDPAAAATEALQGGFGNLGMQLYSLAQRQRQMELQEAANRRAGAVADRATAEAERIRLQREAVEAALPDLYKTFGFDPALAPVLGAAPISSAVSRQFAGAQTAIGKLNEALKARRITPEQHAAAVAKATALPQGTNIKQNPDGTFEITTGGMGGGLSKKTVGDIEAGAFDAAKAASRLTNIAASFDPKFLTLGNRWGNWVSAQTAKINPDLVSPADKQELRDFATFRRRALDNVNQSIKEITGAAMGVEEGRRIRATLPDPGQGIFDQQDPITFKAILDDALADMNKALVRYDFYKEQGAIPSRIDRIPLTNITQQPDGSYIIQDGARTYQWTPN